MRTIEQTICKFDELTDQAKEKARDWYKQTADLHWSDESKDSIDAFCNHFGVSLREWSIGAYEAINYNAQYFNSHFRGMKLKDFDRNAMPTGYYLDCSLWMTFYDTFKSSGDAKAAFDAALYEGFKGWRADLESQLEDEYIDDFMINNEYEFTEEGKFYQ